MDLQDEPEYDEDDYNRIGDKIYISTSVNKRKYLEKSRLW